MFPSSFPSPERYYSLRARSRLLRNCLMCTQVELRQTTLSALQGEFVGAFRQAPRKESSFPTVTTGMRVFFSEGSRVVQDVSIYYGGMGPTTVSATRTCAAIVTRFITHTLSHLCFSFAVFLLESFISCRSFPFFFSVSVSLSSFFSICSCPALSFFCPLVL